MEFTPADYARQLGESLFRELVQGLMDGKYYAIVGPKNIGKGFLLSRVSQQLEIASARVLKISYDEEMSGGKKSFIACFSEQVTGVFGTRLRPKSDTMRIGEAIRRMIEDLLDQQISGLTVLSFKNITALPIALAHELLYALSEIHENRRFNGRFSAIATGRSDFLALAQSPNSPFHFAQRILVYGGSETLCNTYLTNDLVSQIDEDAAKLIHTQTFGSMLLYEPLVALMNTDYRRFALKQWSVENVDGMLRCLKPFNQFKFFDKIRAGNGISSLVANIQNSPRNFRRLMEILSKNDGEVEIKPVPSISIHSNITFLEAFGAIVRDQNSMAHMSPLMRWFLETLFCGRFEADVLCMQDQWDKAWTVYKGLDAETKYRPLSGSARLRLKNILVHWAAGMSPRVEEGPQALLDFFMKGAEHLLCFEKGRAWVEDARGKEVWISSFSNGEDLVSAEYIEKVKSLSMKRKTINQNPDRTAVYANVPLSVKDFSRFGLVLERAEKERVIDGIRFKVYKKHIETLSNQMEDALRGLMEKNLGELRRVLMKTTDDFMLTTGRTPLELDKALHQVCASLGREYYERAMICLLNPTMDDIRNIAADDIRNIYKYPGKADHQAPNKQSKEEVCRIVKAVAEWTASENKTPKPVVLDDEWFESKQILDLKETYSNAGLIPLNAEERLIGMLLFIKKEQVRPTEEEMNLLVNFTSQLSCILRQLQRLAMLRDALHALDDPILINGTRHKTIFMNRKAAELTGKAAGWQPKLERIGELLAPKKGDNLYNSRLEQVKARGTHILYLADYDRHGIRALDWFGSKLLNYHENFVGTVERYHDISRMAKLAEVTREASRQQAPERKALVFLKHLNSLGYGKSEFWILRSDGEKEWWQSFAAIGFDGADDYSGGGIIIPVDGNNALSKLCLQDREILLVRRVATAIPGPPEKYTTTSGLRGYTVQKFPATAGYIPEENEDLVEIPLFLDDDTCFGKIALFFETKKYFTPVEWQHLQVMGQAAAQVVHGALSSEAEQEEKAILGKMLSHRMSPSLERSKYLLNLLEKEAGSCDDNQTGRAVRYIRHQLAKSHIIIKYLLTGMSRPEGDVTEFRVQDLLQDVQDTVRLDVEGYKKYTRLKRENWTCDASIRPECENAMIRGDRNLLWIALENLSVNALEAMADKGQPGEITFSCEKEGKKTCLAVESTMVPMNRGLEAYIARVINSSGKRDELAAVPFYSRKKQYGGTRRGMGLKLVAWVVKNIHRGEINFYQDSDRSVCRFELILFPEGC